MLGCQALDVEVAGRRLVEALTLAAPAGRFIAVLGRNGAGKTLTLHTLAGLRAAARGVVELDGRPLAGWPPGARARRIALLPQAAEDPFPVTALETVLIGRHPHIGFWNWEDERDRGIAREALAAVGLADWGQRIVDTLSGGERRRLAVATLLAQDPGICLLDEPTNHLDPHHQISVLQLFRARADAGGTVLATLHDPTLAARFADDALLLYGDGRWDFGSCRDMLTEERLSALYQSPIRRLAWQDRLVFINA